MAMHEDLAALVEETDVYQTGVQVDAAVKWVLCGVKSPCGLLLVHNRVLPTLSIPRWSAGEGASISIKRVIFHRTGERGLITSERRAMKQLMRSF
jgi:hypothetical protein